MKALGTAVRVVIVHEGPTTKPWAGAEELGDVSLMSVADVERALAASGVRGLPAGHSGSRRCLSAPARGAESTSPSSASSLSGSAGPGPRLGRAPAAPPASRRDVLALLFEPRPLPRSVFRGAERAAWVLLFLTGLFGLAWTIYPLIPAAVVRVFPTFAGYALGLLSAVFLSGRRQWEPRRALVPAALGVLVVAAFDPLAPLRFPLVLAAVSLVVGAAADAGRGPHLPGPARPGLRGRGRGPGRSPSSACCPGPSPSSRPPWSR